MRRREAFGALAGLGLVACDRSRTRGARAGRLSTAPRTPAFAFPSYHVAPALPEVPDRWKLVIGGRVGRPLALTLADLRAMPRIDVRIEQVCVDGWTAVADWAGVPVSELAKACGAKDTPYVEFRSFDAPSETARGYWSSWDRASALHEHTLVAYEMNGAPLTPAHGAPLRLVASLKLGYKLVKYLTEVSFLDKRTGGYWENQGYDWFASV